MARGEGRVWSEFRDILHTDPAFDFWLRWYGSLLGGGERDWQLWREIALIDPAIWDAGPEAVAAEIARIEREHRPAPQATAAHRVAARRLFEMAPEAELTAEGLATQVEYWIEKYLNETGFNRLPEALQPFELLPATLRGIAGSVAKPPTDQRQEDMANRIAMLEAEIVSLQRRLETADSVFWRSFKEQAGKSPGDWKMWGALVSGGYLILGDGAAMAAIREIIGLVKR
ncbi:MAG: hypothetical protein WD969_13250 [Paracoccaceae bacterium]